jgi:hypothetical protein
VRAWEQARIKRDDNHADQLQHPQDTGERALIGASR